MYVSIMIRNVINWHARAQLGRPRPRCIDLVRGPLHMHIQLHFDTLYLYVGSCQFFLHDFLENSQKFLFCLFNRYALHKYVGYQRSVSKGGVYPMLLNRNNSYACTYKQQLCMCSALSGDTHSLTLTHTCTRTRTHTHSHSHTHAHAHTHTL